jgi:hypothetical protein
VGTVTSLHPDLAPLAALLGTWRGGGHGDYPTIDPFDYDEEVVYGHAGKPFVAYTQRTRHADTGQPLHAEAGYLRPGRTAGTAELVIAQPTGITEVHTGTVEDGDGRLVLDLRCDAPGRTPSALPVHVVRRRIVVEDGVLHYDLWMAHDATPESHHLTATLHRDEDD